MGRAALWTMLGAAVLTGIFVGAGGFTFYKAKGYAYLSDDPKVCVGCHIMRPQYDDWSHGSHKAFAVCNECHLPHTNVAAKLYIKAMNGWNHGKAFTLQNFPEPIRIKPTNSVVLEENCIRCHAPVVENIISHGTLGVPTDPVQGADLYGCVRCHQAVGHGPTR